MNSLGQLFLSGLIVALVAGDNINQAGNPNLPEKNLLPKISDKPLPNRPGFLSRNTLRIAEHPENLTEPVDHPYPFGRTFPLPVAQNPENLTEQIDHSFEKSLPIVETPPNLTIASELDSQVDLQLPQSKLQPESVVEVLAPVDNKLRKDPELEISGPLEIQTDDAPNVNTDASEKHKDVLVEEIGAHIVSQENAPKDSEIVNLTETVESEEDSKNEPHPISDSDVSLSQLLAEHDPVVFGPIILEPTHTQKKSIWTQIAERPCPGCSRSEIFGNTGFPSNHFNFEQDSFIPEAMQRSNFKFPEEHNLDGSPNEDVPLYRRNIMRRRLNSLRSNKLVPELRLTKERWNTDNLAESYPSGNPVSFDTDDNGRGLFSWNWWPSNWWSKEPSTTTAKTEENPIILPPKPQPTLRPNSVAPWSAPNSAINTGQNIGPQNPANSKPSLPTANLQVPANNFKIPPNSGPPVFPNSPPFPLNNLQVPANNFQPANNLQGPANNLQGPVNNLQGPANNLQVPVNNLQGSANNLQIPANNLQVPANNLQVPANNLQLQTNNLHFPVNTVSESSGLYPTNNLQVPANNLQVPANNLQLQTNNLHFPVNTVSESSGPYPTNNLQVPANNNQISANDVPTTSYDGHIHTDDHISANNKGPTSQSVGPTSNPPIIDNSNPEKNIPNHVIPTNTPAKEEEIPKDDLLAVARNIPVAPGRFTRFNDPHPVYRHVEQSVNEDHLKQQMMDTATPGGEKWPQQHPMPLQQYAPFQNSGPPLPPQNAPPPAQFRCPFMQQFRR